MDDCEVVKECVEADDSTVFVELLLVVTDLVIDVMIDSSNTNSPSFVLLSGIGG